MSLMRFAFIALAALLAATAAHAQIALRGAASAASAVGASATVAYGGVGNAATDSGNCPQSMSPGLPAGTAAGDLLIATVTAGDTNAIAMNGWSTLYANANGGYQAAVFWRIATGADPVAITKTGGGCNVMLGRISRFTGVDTTSPFDGGVGASYQNANTVTTGSITTSNATSMLVIAAHTNDDSDTGAPAGFTEAWDSQTTTGNDVSVSIKYQAQTTAGGKGAYSMSKTRGSDPNHGVLFALRPAPNGLTINKPAGTVSGDVMLAFITVRDSSVQITAPAGWSSQAAVVQNAGNSSRQRLFYKVAGGAEPASYTWSFDSAHNGAAGGIVSYSGVDTVAPINAYGGNVTPQGGDSNLQHRALAVTTTVTDTRVITAHSYSSSDTWTPPAGMTERVDIASQPVPNAAGVAIEINDVAQVATGTTGSKLATAAGNGDTGAALIVALRPLVVQPVLQWTMDQTTWNGTAGEVIDASGNGLHGRAVNGTVTANTTPAIAGSPGTCRYGSFDGANDYVEVASNALLNITDELTVMMWLRPTAWPTGGNLKSFMSKDNNYEAHLNSTGRIDWWWGGGAQELVSAGSVPLNTWTHVAIVYSRAGGFQRIYLNGVQDANTNNQTAALATNNLPFQIGGDQGFAGREWPGQVDEVYVFHSALPQTRIQQYMNTTRPCASAINHFAISHAGSGVGCVDQPITITAHDATHAAVDANALTVNLSTTNASGTWTGIQAGGGTLNDPVAGDGAATYTFAAGSNSVTLLFRYSSLSAVTETFGFNVSGGGYSETTGTASASDDPSFTMAQAGFRLRNVEDASETLLTQISGKPSNTGWNARSYRLQAINTNTSSGACTSLFASQSQTIELGAECNSPAACAARQVSVNGSNIATSANNGGAGAAAYTGVSLAFNASSEADVVLSYPDAGQISLHARYDLNPLVAGYEMIGSSNSYVVRPFGLAFPGVSHGNTAAGSLIGAAGDNFSMTVQGYQWASGEDADADGVPDAGVNITDNGTVPNFAATATVGRSANLPGVALGAVSRGAGCASAATIGLSGGTATAADWCYSEAGNVLLTADVTNYITAGVNVTGSSGLDGVAGGGYVGRFRPKTFVVTGTPTLVNRAALACAPASTFTYMGEGLSLGFTLQARNTQNALTQNYTGAYARLNLATAASLGLGARSGATNLTPRVDSSLAPAGSFSNGSAVLAVTTGVRRASPDNPDGPYAATQFGIAPNDADGVQMQSLNQDVDGVGGNDHYAVAPTTELRFGRLLLQNDYGPVSNALQLPLDVQYWNGSGFAVNTADSCTTLARANLALAFSGVIAACNTAVVQPSLAFSSGQSTLTLAAPGAGKTGTVTVTPQLGTAAGSYCPAVGAGTAAATASAANYLLGRWDDASNPDGNANTAYDDKPAGRASFGLYGSPPKSFIFLRENY